MIGSPFLQNVRKACQSLGRGIFVVNEGKADIARSGVIAVRFAGKVFAGDNAYASIAPKAQRGIFAVADVEP